MLELIIENDKKQGDRLSDCLHMFCQMENKDFNHNGKYLKVNDIIMDLKNQATLRLVQKEAIYRAQFKPIETNLNPPSFEEYLRTSVNLITPEKDKFYRVQAYEKICCSYHLAEAVHSMLEHKRKCDEQGTEEPERVLFSKQLDEK